MTRLRAAAIGSRCAAFALFALVTAAVHAQDRFVISSDGQEVTDSTTKLVWRRCGEGQSWDGKTCSGCNLFVPPNACKTVDGTISPSGWCALWVKKAG